MSGIKSDSAIARKLRDGLTDGITPAWPGAVFAAWSGGRAVCADPVGAALRWVAPTGPVHQESQQPIELAEPDREPVTVDTLFDLASITKIFTAVITQVVADSNQISLDTPLSRFFEQYAPAGRDLVTLRQLLTHTSGLPPVNPIFRLPAEQRRSAVLSCELRSRPGERFDYSCVGFQTLALWAERVCGLPLARLLAQIITEPLGLRRTGFCPTEPGSITATGIAPHQIAATELVTDSGSASDEDSAPRMLRGVVHDEAARSLDGQAGNAGIFSTASELGRFGELLRNRGTLDGQQILPERCFAEMIRPQLPDDLVGDYQHGLGVRIGAATLLGPSPTAFGHGGFTGTALAISPEHDLVMVLLSNRVHPHREMTGDIWRQRQAVLDAAVRTYG